jgi:hypothetical protein
MGDINMKRTILAAACILLLPALVQAAAFTATLTGDAGSGFATIHVVGDDIDYNILVSGMSPNAAVLTDGTDAIDLQAAFTNGTAIGSVSSSQASDIAADPSSWEVQVGDGSSFLTGTLSTGASESTMLYLPVIATVAGQGGTDFHTDGRFVNRSGATATVEFSFWAQSAGGNGSPSVTTTLTIGANEQLVLDDMATELFGVTNGSGGVSISSDRVIFGSARIYNDQITAGEGTFGQYATAVSMDDATMSGAVEFLSNRPAASGAGYRSNIGWFNPNGTNVEVTFYGWDADGTMLGTIDQTAGRNAQNQKRLDQLWPALADFGDLYITFTASAPIFVYGSVVDNVNGDAIYITATESP